MSLDVSRIVAVDISVSSLALQRAGFGILNIIGTSDVIPISERTRSYNSITDVAADFATTDEEYISAQIFFSQSPRPTTLYISRRAVVGLAARIYGSTTVVETSLATWQAISDADDAAGAPDADVSAAIDFSGATSMDNVAALIDAELTGSTVTWTGERFIIDWLHSGALATIELVVDQAGGTYIGGLMGCSATSDGAFVTSGVNGETIPESLNAIEVVNSKWYGFAFTKEVRDDSVTSAGTAADALDAAAWAEARTKVFCNNSSDANTLTGTDTTNISYQLDQLGYSRTPTVYNAGDYPAISMFARGATVDFNGTDTVITYKFKQLPGLSPTDLSASQADALIGFNCNYYAEFGTQLSGDSVSMLAEGVVANGRFFDEVVGVDWLQNSIQTDVFNYLFQSTTKTPQTNEGVSGIAQVLENTLAQAVTNGLAAPGEVVIDGNEIFLDKGYLVFTTPVEDQNQADREARKAPPISFVLNGAGSIHNVTITGTIVR